MSYMEHTIKITFTAQALGKSVPLWRVMDTIASLIAPKGPAGIGWYPEKYNRLVSIWVSTDYAPSAVGEVTLLRGTITERTSPEDGPEQVVHLGTWRID